MKSLYHLSILSVVESLPQIYQNNRKNFFSALGVIFEALNLHDELRQPILKAAAGVTIEIDGEHHCLLDFFQLTPLDFPDINKTDFDAIISKTAQQLINASTQVYFFEKEHDIIFALAHSVYGRRLLSQYWPTDSRGSNRCASMLNQHFLFGPYRGIKLSLYYLLKKDILTPKILLSQSFRTSLTVDSLNEKVTQQGDFQYLSLALVLSHFVDGIELLVDNECALGRLISSQTLNTIALSGEYKDFSVSFFLAITLDGHRLLAKNDYALGKRISKQTLNHIISSGSHQGNSVAVALAGCPEGIRLLAHNEFALGQLISKETLNTIIPTSQYQGQSVAFWLTISSIGRQLLAHNEFALGQLITEKTLNHIISSGSHQGKSVAIMLAEHIIGRQLLAHNGHSLGQLISKETLNHIIPSGDAQTHSFALLLASTSNAIIPSGRSQGLSVAFVLASTPEGRQLFAYNECALGQLISKQTLNTIIPSGQLQGQSVASLLVNSEDGKLILKHNNYHLGKCITIEGLKNSGMTFFSTMQKSLSAKIKKRTDETAPGTEKGINNNNSCRLM